MKTWNEALDRIRFKVPLINVIISFGLIRFFLGFFPNPEQRMLDHDDIVSPERNRNWLNHRVLPRLWPGQDRRKCMFTMYHFPIRALLIIRSHQWLQQELQTFSYLKCKMQSAVRVCVHAWDAVCQVRYQIRKYLTQNVWRHLKRHLSNVSTVEKLDGAGCVFISKKQ